MNSISSVRSSQCLVGGGRSGDCAGSRKGRHATRHRPRSDRSNSADTRPPQTRNWPLQQRRHASRHTAGPAAATPGPGNRCHAESRLARAQAASQSGALSDLSGSCAGNVRSQRVDPAAQSDRVSAFPRSDRAAGLAGCTLQNLAAPAWPASTVPRQSTGLMRQMRSAYSRMLRSLENVPMPSALSTAFRLHSSGCRYSASTSSCALA